MGWIQIPIDPKLLPGSGTRKIDRWIGYSTVNTDKNYENNNKQIIKNNNK